MPRADVPWIRMVVCVSVALCVSSYSVPAHAQFGQPIVEVRTEQEGRPVDDPTIIKLIDTRVGEPLSMRVVRETISHLMSLNRFEDAQPSIEPVPNGIRLTWVLVPLHPVDRVDFIGNPALSVDDLRRVVTERFGSSPSATRASEIADMLRVEYRRRGYLAATVTPRVEVTHDPDRATLVLDVNAGLRAKILGVRVNQNDADGQSTITDLPDIRQGQPYDEQAISRELQEWESRMRSDRYYEARASSGTDVAPDGAFVAVNLTRGPHVEVRFAGDPLPENERDRLVPVRAESSADEDLLEDGSRAIEAYLHARGYRDASAQHTRDELNGELVITFQVIRGPRYLLRNVTITGNAAMATTELGQLLRLKEGEPFVRSVLTTGVRAIENAYATRGFRAQVKPADSVQAPGNPADPDRRVNLTIAIVEGPRAVVRSVVFQGNMALTVAELRTVTALAPGRPYSAADVIADRDRIEQAYRDRGYESIVVTPEPVFSEKDTQADVRFTISEGPLIIVDHIIIVGNRRISTGTIERELVLKSGQPLGDAALAESRANLVALGLFRRIQIESVAHTGEPRRDVLVRVEESPPRTIDVGGGVEGGYLLRTGVDGVAEERFEIAPRGTFEIGRRNLWGKNRSVSLFTRVSLRSRDPAPDTSAPPGQTIAGNYGFNEYRVVGTYREPKAFSTSADVLLTASIEQAIRSSFNFSRREVRAQAGLRVSQIYNLSGLYSFQKIKLFDEKIIDEEDRPLIDRLFSEVRLSKLSGTLIRDTTDPLETLDPSHGTRVTASGDVAARAIGSEVGFAKTYLQGFFYRRLPVPRRTVLALGARVGAAHGFPRERDGEVVQDLPASERFFAGGESSVRGFSLDRLGNALTITETGYPKGGNGVVVLNSELRVSLFARMQAVGFLDAGNVFARVSDLSFTDLRPAAGFGVLFVSPFGPIRVDLGFNLDPREFVPGSPERRHVWHFLLGQPF